METSGAARSTRRLAAIKMDKSAKPEIAYPPCDRCGESPGTVIFDHYPLSENGRWERFCEPCWRKFDDETAELEASVDY